MEIRRHHADHRVIAGAELDGFTDDVRIAREPSLPQAVAENDNEIFAILLFLRGEDPAEQRLRMHDREKPIAHLRAGHALGFAIARKDRPEIGIGGDFFEHMIPRAIIRDIGCRHLSARTAAGFVFAPNENNRLRLVIRQRFQQDGIDHTEDRRVRADPEREGNDGDRGEARTFQKHSGAEPNVLEECVHITVLSMP